MYASLLFLHSYMRWLVLAGLLYAIFRAYKGYCSKTSFSKTDNAIRHWAATLAHIQLMVGIGLYFNSPVVKSYWANAQVSSENSDGAFFGVIHIVLMFVAIVVLTAGSALSKRKPTDHEKFRTMLVWFFLALIIILIAIPWPFSPLAVRPYFR